MVNEFYLTRENAKEYFFLNHCRLMNIDIGDENNAKKFRGYNFDDATICDWTNEWLLSKFDGIDTKSDIYEFISIINDIGSRMTDESAKRAISIYKDLKNELNGKQRIELLFRHKYSEVLKMHFYYGLIYIAIKNKMTEALDPLLSELNDLLKEQPKETAKEYDKSLKRLFKDYKLKK